MKQSILFLTLLLLSTGFVYQTFGPWPLHPLLTATAVSSVTEPASTSADTVSIAWVGDMVPPDSDAYATSAFANVQNVLATTTVTLGNFEGTFAENDASSKCVTLTSNCHAFRGTPLFATALKNAGFTAVNLANNHSLDFGEAGLIKTETTLTAAGLPYVSSTAPITSITKNGLKIGLVGLSSTPTTTIADYDFIKKSIAVAKTQNDMVVVLFHGGNEGADKTWVPNNYEYFGDENRGYVRRMAQVAIDAGADAVLGSGPHVLRGIELYHGKPIAYSLGNFVGSEKLTTENALGISAILQLHFKKDGTFLSGSIVPITLATDGTPHPDANNRAVKTLSDLSQKNFGITGAVFSGNNFK